MQHVPLCGEQHGVGDDLVPTKPLPAASRRSARRPKHCLPAQPLPKGPSTPTSPRYSATTLLIASSSSAKARRMAAEVFEGFSANTLATRDASAAAAYLAAPAPPWPSNTPNTPVSGPWPPMLMWPRWASSMLDRQPCMPPYPKLRCRVSSARGGKGDWARVLCRETCIDRPC